MEKKDKVKRIVGIAVLAVLTVILLPILIVNLTLIIKSSINPDVPPDIFGTAPLAVMTDSMNGDEEDSFAGGALILVDLLDEEEKQDLTVGQIVTFRDTDENGDVFFVTHRIVEIGKEGGRIATVTTRGDANTGNDAPTDIADVIGVCTSSIGGLGGFAIFLQTPAGILVCVGIPVLAYIVYDVLRIYWNNRKAKADTVIDEKDAEIARLRALVEQQNGGAPAEAAFCSPGIRRRRARRGAGICRRRGRTGARRRRRWAARRRRTFARKRPRRRSVCGRNGRGRDGGIRRPCRGIRRL